MAGTYADAPSRRMAWDADGSIGIGRDQAGSFVNKEWSAADMAELNDEDNTIVDDSALTGQSLNTNTWLHIVFPELREVDGVFVAVEEQPGNNGRQILTSPNTVDTYGGTWNTQVAAYAPPGTSYPTNYRQSITSLAVSSARAIRFADIANSGGYLAFHVYGEISPGQTPDRLLFINEATGLEYTLPQDFGDVPRGSSEDWEWRIKNNSASLQANNIQYTAEALYLTSGGWYTFTTPGGATYQATQQVASLAAATTTGIITGRRITPGGIAVGAHAGRIRLTTDTWT